MAAADADAEPPPVPDDVKESDMDTIATSADPSDNKLEDGGKNKSTNNVGRYAALSRALVLQRRRATASVKAANLKSKKPKEKNGPTDGCPNSSSARGEPSTTSASNAAPPTATLRALLHKFFAQLQGHGHLPNGGSRKQQPPPSEEKIQEWKRRMEEGKVPGVVGIKNHGNTCFINAILQCLSYTDILAEYFVLDQYKSDLRRKRRISSLAALKKRAATAANGANSTDRGEVTEQLAVLLKSMWSLQYDPEISIRFKSLVEKHASQYKGSSQHDAQEFLLWLLDQVHEDLNLASRRRYKPPPPPPPPPHPQPPVSNGISKNGHANLHNQQCNDEVMAAEALAAYMRCNNSFVMDVFQAQFRSSLQCPTCERVSNTFDPFLCVSLPIPHRVLLSVFVTVLYIDQCPRQVRLGLTVEADDTIGGLRSVLAKDTGIDVDRLLLCEIDDACFRRTFRDRESVQLLKGAQTPLYCIETPDYKEPSDDNGAFAVLTWINVFKDSHLQAGGKRVEKRFGSPYTIQVSRETLYTDLQKLLMKEMAPILHDDILISAQKVPLFKIRVLDCLEGRESPSNAHSEKAKSDKSDDQNLDKDKEAVYVDPIVDLPLYTEMVEQAINLGNLERENSGSGVPTHVKLVLEWDMPAKTQVINDDGDSIEEHASVKEVEATMRAEEDTASVSLQECFSLYTSAEKLGIGDAWLCPSCNRKQEVVKRMGLWSVPDVLVIHLKRFRQTSGSSTNKITTLVDFPLENFDMTPNMAKQQNKEMAAKQHFSQHQQSAPAAVPTADVDCNITSLTSNGASLTSNGLNGMWSALSPWKNPKKFVAAEIQHKLQRNSSDDSVFELYAVCNHHGSDLQGGHYTAFCKNPTDGQWYNFDDVRTKSIPEQEVVTNDAYILFYQRQSSLFNSSQSSSSDSSNSEHWVFRMPDFTYKRKTPGAATSCATAASTSPKESEKSAEGAKAQTPSASATASSNFVRNGGKYATMVPVTKRASGELEGEADGERRHSDVDLVSEEGDDGKEQPEKGISSDSQEATNSTKSAERTTKSDGYGGDDDEICRPVDKNDVD